MRQARRSDRRPVVFQEPRRPVDTVIQMMGMHSFPGKAGSLLLASLTLALSFGPARAGAAILDSEGGDALSPGLVGLADPSTALPDEVPILIGEGPDKLLRDGNRVLVYVRFDRGAAAGVGPLQAAGAEVVNVSRRYQTVTVAAAPEELQRVAAVAGVASVAPVREPIVAGATAHSVSPCFGTATSEGDQQLNAMAARTGFEVDGSGVEVGILSDSFNRDGAADTDASADVASGDLPGPSNPCGYASPVQVLDDSAGGGEDEGRAMAQIVHDLAPGADLAFASAFGGVPDFAENIKKLGEEGAKVIADDVFYPEEPFFQDGPVAVAVNEVVASGATYLSAAGNDNLIDGKGRDIASWEAPKFRNSGSCPSGVVALSEKIEEAEGPGAGLRPSNCMDFDPGPADDETFGIVVSKGATLIADLQWAEPWNGVKSDLDAFLLNSAGEVIELSVKDNSSNSGTQKPFEEVEWENNTGAAAIVRLVINRYSGSKVTPLKFALLENGSGVAATEYAESSGGDTVGPTIFGHSGAANAVSIAAAPYFNSEEPESYSSHGPVVHYYGPVAGATPAEPLLSPEVIEKPDVTATDGGANTFFGSCQAHTWRFYGTSAAAPHAAAVAALELAAEPGATPAEVTEALTHSASPMAGFPPEVVGSGLVDAPEAISAIESVPFPGGKQLAPPTPQNCGFPRPPTSGGPPPVSPLPSPLPEEETKRVPNPRTFFLLRPTKVVRTHHHQARAVFRFGSNESDASFVCRVDGGFFRPCPARLTRQFPIGRHLVKVAARDAAGNGDKSPASYSFKVKRVR
jgi:Subtilase family